MNPISVCCEAFLLLSLSPGKLFCFLASLNSCLHKSSRRPLEKKVRCHLTLCVMALAWTVSQSKSCLGSDAYFLNVFLFFFLPLRTTLPPPSTCILPLNTNKMECVANPQMGSNPTAVKRLRLIWFSLWFHRKLDLSQGADTPWTRLGDNTSHNRRQWNAPH